MKELNEEQDTMILTARVYTTEGRLVKRRVIINKIKSVNDGEPDNRYIMDAEKNAIYVMSPALGVLKDHTISDRWLIIKKERIERNMKAANEMKKALFYKYNNWIFGVNILLGVYQIILATVQPDLLNYHWAIAAFSIGVGCFTKYVRNVSKKIIKELETDA